MCTGGGHIFVCTLVANGLPREDLAEKAGLLRAAFGVEPVEDTVGNAGWFDIATGLYDVIDGIKGSPTLATLQHGGGYDATTLSSSHATEYLEWIVETVYGKLPWELAPTSLVEIRTLGGAARHADVPSGNCHVDCFWDQILTWDASAVDESITAMLCEGSERLVEAARAHTRTGVVLEMSATHGQSDSAATPSDDAAATMLGGVDNLAAVRAVKARFDPRNTFRFHPIRGLV
jgi:FAD/FMN-containing dehydrogenase